MNITNFTQPDAEQVARGNSEHICLLLQLILGAAVNCDHKNDFIAGLMQLDEIDQDRILLKLKDMDLDVSQFFNLEQLITGWFKDTKGSIF